MKTETAQELPLSKTRAADSDNPAVRTQLALIRSITDELRRLPPSDSITRALSAQLEEELSRLDRLVEPKPGSGVHAIRVRDAG